MSTSAFWLAVCEALVWAELEANDRPGHEQAVERAALFLEGQLASLPLLLRLGQRLGLAGFRFHVRSRYLRGFCRLDLATRIAAVESWAGGPVTACRQLFRLLRNLALLAYYEDLAQRSAAIGQQNRSSPTSRGVSTAGSRLVSTRREERAGVLVIGSGAGGAVTALELAAHGHDVLLLEEGARPSDEPPDAGATDTMEHLYRHRGMTPILGPVPIAYVEGRCVGGSTEINSGFWHRPPRETLLRWKSQYDLADASPEELRPHWEWAEAMLGVSLQDGPLPPSSKVFARGAQAMDWAVNEVPRTAANARTAPSASTAGTRGPRPGMSRSVIPKAVDAGARLLTGCRVERLEVKGTRIVSASARRRHEDGSIEHIRVRADHVFLCAGPTETPSLLRRSGVTRHVGDSLSIHPMLKLAARFREDMASGPGSLPLLQSKQFWPDIVLGGSFFSPGHLAVVLADNWSVTRGRMKDIDRMACYYVGVRGTGRGRVRPSRLEPDRTDIHYELSHEDIWNLSRGVARLAMLLLEGGAIEVLPAVHGLPAIRNEVEAVHWLDDRLDGRKCSLTTVHAFSSCPMGERLDRCAANSFGRLHGFDNVYLNDASIVPDSPGVNPQGTIMTLARRNALHFCDEHSA